MESLPLRIFEEVSADLFQHAGNKYLVYTDRLSGWPVIASFRRESTNSNDIICVMRKFFSDLGIPCKLRTDEGPHFSSHQYNQFLRKYGIIHVKSSPHYPQSNGHAEATVKSIKSIILKTTENGVLNNEQYLEALLEYRNTPKESGIPSSNGIRPSPPTFSSSTPSLIRSQMALIIE